MREQVRLHSAIACRACVLERALERLRALAEPAGDEMNLRDVPPGLGERELVVELLQHRDRGLRRRLERLGLALR